MAIFTANQNIMEKQKEVQKEEEKQTPDNTDHVDEKNTPEGEETKGEEVTNPEDEYVKIPKKEYEITSQRAKDFDKSIELRRLAKLEKKKDAEAGGENNADVIQSLTDEISALKEQFSSSQNAQKNAALSEAYREFVGDNKWADNDEIFAKISEDFNTEGLNTKQEMLAKLKSTALSKFPDKYEKHLSQKAKAQALAEKSNIGAGSGTGGSDNNEFAKEGETDEEKISKEFMKGFPRHFAINKKLDK